MTDIHKILLGGGLAIIGGIIGKFISVFVDEWRERKFIKQNLTDELNEIIEVIKKFEETYNSSDKLMPTYVTQLKANMEAYEACRNRLFLIIRNGRRMEIIHFYRDLQKIIEENEGKMGSLSAEQGKSAAQTEIINKFTGLQTKAKNLNTALSSYNPFASDKL